MSTRANSSNSTGIGYTQTQAGNVTPINTWLTTFPRPAGQTITVKVVNGQMNAAGAAVGDTVERDSDGGFWDSTAGCNVPPENTSIGSDDMRSN